MSEEFLSFEEWFKVISSFDSNDDMWNCSETMFEIPPIQISNFLQHLFINSAVLCTDLTDDRLCQMIWFFQGVRSSYWHEVRSSIVPKELQIETVRSLGTFYRDFLDVYLRRNGTVAPETEGAVYMIWDMDCLEGAAMFPGEEHLIDPIFEVLGIALRCKSFACQRSALHGLGHLARYHPQRVKSEIDWALKKPNHLHESLRNYAIEARSGDIL